MKKLITLVLFVSINLFSVDAFASLEIFCPKDKEISYQTYLNGNYYDKPVVWGYHTLYGPWIKPSLNCGSGYVDVKWEIVDHYAKSYYCTQTIWVSGGTAEPISVWCPKETTLYCDEVDSYKFPKPEVWGWGYTITGPWISKKLNDCGVGSIWVEWKVTDGCGKATYCKSVYWVKERYSKVNIWWPKDFDADACKDQTDPKLLPYPYGYPEINSYNKCGKYGINYRDEIYTFPNDPGICRKIVRIWTVIDWCTYNPNALGYEKEGIWQHHQLIKVLSKSKPSLSCKPEVKADAETYGKTAWIDIPIPTVTNSCNGQAVVTHNSKYATKPNSSDASGNYPIGITEVIFTVTDACSNFTQCTTRVNVVDKAPPTPYCIASLIAGIGWYTDGVYTIIDPKKFDVGSYDNCTPKEKLKFTASPSKLTCDSLGTRNIKIWVEDEAGNKNFCSVKIILQDNQGMCPKKISKDTLTIAGLVNTTSLVKLDSVTISLLAVDDQRKQIAKGTYKFSEVRSGNTYRVTPSKKGDFMDGITIEDFNLLINFLDKKDTFKYPAQYLAADITGNDTIDLEDVLTLGNYLASKGAWVDSSQAVWRFIPSTFNLNNLSIKNNSIEHVPGYLDFKNIDRSRYDVDFVGIKLGDINLSLFDTAKVVKSLAENINLESRSRPITFSQTQVKVFPNPFSEKVLFSVIQSIKSDSPVSFSIHDVSGRQIYSKITSILQGVNQIEISSDKFPGSGIYFYRINLPNELISGKIIYNIK